MSVYEDGVILATRPALNFGAGIVATDNPAEDRIDITVTGEAPADLQPVSEKGQAGGYAALDANGDVPLNQTNPASSLMNVAGLSPDQSWMIPVFDRVNGGQPIWTLQMATAGTPPESIYSPCLWAAGKFLSGISPDRYWRLYYSTDHATDRTFEHIRYADGPTYQGPFTDRGFVYQHPNATTYSGGETPSVIWVPDDPNGQAVYLFYHVRMPSGSGQQNTHMVKSQNGLTGWTTPVQAVVLTNDEYGAAETHTGYARHFKFGPLWGMHHLAAGAGSSTTPGYTVSFSRTARGVWATDPRIEGAAGAIVRDAGWEDFTVRDIVQYAGGWWASGFAANPASGVIPRSGWPAMVRLSDDLRRTVGSLQRLLPDVPTAAENGVALGLRDALCQSVDGRLVAMYQYDNRVYMAVSRYPA